MKKSSFTPIKPWDMHLLGLKGNICIKSTWFEDNLRVYISK